MCSEDMEPALRPLIKIHTFEETQALVAKIPEIDPAQKPCYARGTGITKGRSL
jgi:ATP-dependent DNA helicase RecG